MTKRKSLSKKLRFEVFKRDSFACQYCGSKAPDVLLHVDHIKPVSKGGDNDLLNLITACQGCNAGKSDRELGDTTVIDKQRDQLEALQERKEQIEMMFEWQKALMNLDDDVIEQLSSYWSELIPGYHFNENGLRKLRSLKKKYEIDEILQAMKIAVDQYLRYEGGEPISESVEIASSKLPGICSIRRTEKDDPDFARLFYIRGILRNRLGYFNEVTGMELLKEAYEAGIPVDNLEKHAKEVRTWTQWRDELHEAMEDGESEE